MTFKPASAASRASIVSSARRSSKLIRGGREADCALTSVARRGCLVKEAFAGAVPRSAGVRAARRQATCKSGTRTFPFVSGLNSNAQAKLSAPMHVPTSIGTARNPACAPPQVRTRLHAGGNRIRTIGPSLEQIVCLASRTVAIGEIIREPDGRKAFAKYC
jgi:hypothetical protein